MFLPEVDDGNFTTYYRGTWVLVTFLLNGVRVAQYRTYHGNNVWRDINQNSIVIDRNNILHIEAPPLGYYEENGVPLFAYRLPARITSKGICSENSRNSVMKDYQELRGVTAVDWSAYKQPVFNTFTNNSIAECVARIRQGNKAFNILSPELAVILNCTDGGKGVYANLFWREMLVGKYDRNGSLLEGNKEMLRMVGVR